MAIVVTHISAAAGAMTWMFIEWKKFGKPTVLGIVTGMVAGLGTITPASGFVGPAGALVIGSVAGIVCFNAVLLLKTVLKIDDSLDVFPVHGVGGIIGTLMAGVFASTDLGVFSGQGFAEGIMTMQEQLSVQLTGVIATILYTAVATFVILKVVDLMVGIRVCEECEVEGLDVYAHGEQGYFMQ
jgi:Amt family ammonium transporter